MILAIALLAALPARYTSTEVSLPRLPGSQSPRLVAARPLEAPLRLFEREFEVEELRDRLLVATTAGAERKQKLRADGELELHWSEDGEPRARTVRFERDSRGQWFHGPARARLFDLEGEAFYLVDADLDGEFGDLLSDGWSREPGGPLLPLARELIVGTRHVALGEIASDGSSLEARVVPIAGSRLQLEALTRLNDLRTAVGLPGVALEPELSLGCTQHARYLAASGWDGKLQVRDQEPGAEAATRAGREAAKQGFMQKGRGARALQSMWDDPLGRALLLSPELVAVGLSDDVQAEAFVIDPRSRGTHKHDPTLRWSRLIDAPCDRGLVRSAGKQPLLVRVTRTAAAIDSYSANLWRVDGGKRQELAMELLEGLEPLSCAGLRPTKALVRGATYEFEHRLEVDGELWTQRGEFVVR